MKKRIFAPDFVRAIAVILIILTHYNARYLWLGTEIAYKKMILGITTFNIYIGGLGVSLFLIISGYALMYTYGEKIRIWNFYQKRFWSLYPMFWIAYLVAFLHQFYCYKGMVHAAPLRNLFFSVIGIDDYLSNAHISTFYVLGEWFLGFMIMFYMIFPALRWGIMKYPQITGTIILVLYGTSILYYDLDFPQNMFLFVRLPELAFGMYFQRYIDKVNWKAAVISMFVLLANVVIAPAYSQDIQTTYVGISFFLLLVYISRHVKESYIIVSICRTLCKYSYSIFLVHHYIIAYFMGKFDLNNITVLESWILFLLICCVIGGFARLLYLSNEYVCRRIKLSWKIKGDKS